MRNKKEDGASSQSANIPNEYADQYPEQYPEQYPDLKLLKSYLYNKTLAELEHNTNPDKKATRAYLLEAVKAVYKSNKEQFEISLSNFSLVIIPKYKNSTFIVADTSIDMKILIEIVAIQADALDDPSVVHEHYLQQYPIDKNINDEVFFSVIGETLTRCVIVVGVSIDSSWKDIIKHDLFEFDRTLSQLNLYDVLNDSIYVLGINNTKPPFITHSTEENKVSECDLDDMISPEVDAPVSASYVLKKLEERIEEFENKFNNDLYLCYEKVFELFRESTGDFPNLEFPDINFPDIDESNSDHYKINELQEKYDLLEERLNNQMSFSKLWSFAKKPWVLAEKSWVFADNKYEEFTGYIAKKITK
jgi:hypothetical protein